MGLGGEGVVSVSLGPGGCWPGPATPGWLSWTATGAGAEAGGPGGCPGWWGLVPPRCSVAGGLLFQAHGMAAGVGSGFRRCWGGQSICPGVRSSCWCQAGLSKLRRGACGERRLLRPHHVCGAGRVRGSAARPMGCEHLAPCGSCGHAELCAEKRVPRTPRLGLCALELIAGKVCHRSLSCWDTLARVNSWDSQHHLPGWSLLLGSLVGRWHDCNSHFLWQCHPLLVLLSDLALPMSVTGSALVQAVSLLTHTCLSKKGTRKGMPMS